MLCRHRDYPSDLRRLVAMRTKWLLGSEPVVTSLPLITALSLCWQLIPSCCSIKIFVKKNNLFSFKATMVGKSWHHNVFLYHVDQSFVKMNLGRESPFKSLLFLCWMFRGCLRLEKESEPFFFYRNRVTPAHWLKMVLQIGTIQVKRPKLQYQIHPVGRSGAVFKKKKKRGTLLP